MLQVDPLKRATVEEIKKHDWFQKELPAYLFPSPVEHDSSVIDIKAIEEVCEKFNVRELEVHSALLSGDIHDQLAIAYHLIIDNKRIADEAAKAEIKDFYVANSPPTVGPKIPEMIEAGANFKPHPERIAPLRDKAVNSSSTIERHKGTPLKRAKWHLGIRSQRYIYNDNMVILRNSSHKYFFLANQMI